MTLWYPETREELAFVEKGTVSYFSDAYHCLEITNLRVFLKSPIDKSFLMLFFCMIVIDKNQYGLELNYWEISCC